MPQILVEADRRDDSDNRVVYRERINLSDLESDHFSGQLVERVGWAVLDADAHLLGSSERKWRVYSGTQRLCRRCEGERPVLMPPPLCIAGHQQRKSDVRP